MTTIFVHLILFSLSLVYSNGQRRPSDWGSIGFGQRDFGDERGNGRDMFRGFRPTQMGRDFGRGRPGDIDRDLFGSRDPMGVGGQGRGTGQGEVPAPSQPPVDQNPVGQNPGMGPSAMPEQPQVPENPDQVAQEQGLGRSGQPPPPSPGVGREEPDQFLRPEQGEVPAEQQPPMAQAPGEMGQDQGIGQQDQLGRSPMEQIPNSMGQAGGIGQGQRGEPPMSQRPPMDLDPNQGEPRQNELPPAGQAGVQPNPRRMGQPQIPSPSLVRGQTGRSRGRSGFGEEGDMDEPEKEISRPPRGK